MNIPQDLHQLKVHYCANGEHVVAFRCIEKLGHEKRSKWDNSKWLHVWIVKPDGTVKKVVASHNNNQKVSLSANYHCDEKFKGKLC